MRISLGLKIWSPNIELADQAKDLFDRGELEYVELFCYPDSYAETAQAWRRCGLPFVVHAPHSMTGLNLAKCEMRSRNAQLAEESYRMADAVRAKHVIFHPGAGGSLAETIDQAIALRDPRMLMENKPFAGLNGVECVGSTPEEISELTRAIGCGFCLDFGHAVAAANSHGLERSEFIHRFIELGPAMYHLTDGQVDSELDAHEAYGAGSFPLAEFLALVPDGSMVTDEAKRKDPGLGEYLLDRKSIRVLLGEAAA